METIKNYLDAMFLHLPGTPEVFRAKNELAQMMEDKYTELIAGGMRENEAVGTVITEFGNLDELAESLGIQDVMAGGEKTEQTQSRAQNNAGYAQEQTQGSAARNQAQGSAAQNQAQGNAAQDRTQGNPGAAPFPGYTTAKTVYPAEDGTLYESKGLATFMSVYWLSVTCIYLIWSFLSFRWGITWIIWPIAGIIRAIIKKAFAVKTREQR